mgnify:CR=1 FL=1
MLFKIWMCLPDGYDGSIIVEASSLDDAVKIANELGVKYKATIKAIDNIYYGSNKSASNKNRSIQGIKGDRKHGYL